jgi:Cu+-exporting ATPase
VTAAKLCIELFSENDLTCYYDLQDSPGAVPKEIEGKYDFLDLKTKIIDKLTEFRSVTP